MPSPVFKCFPQTPHYHDIRTPPEVVKQAFAEACNGKDYMSISDVISYINRSRGDDHITEAQAEALLGKLKDGSDHHLHNLFHHHKKGGNVNGGLDLSGFMKLLLSPEANSILKPKEKSHDMTQPLSQYYVHTSHNSYLTGNQLTSRSSTTPIIEALKEGCRVIELDCWERRGKIKVLHGGTLTKPVKFDACIKAIKHYAFVASDYPVIVTIENHLPAELQIQAAKIMKNILGELLFIPSPEERPPLEFLSPEALKGKIIISDKPLREPVEEQVEDDPEGAVETAETILQRGGDSSPEVDPKNRHPKVDKKALKKAAKAYEAATPDPEIPLTQEFEELLYIHCEKPSEMKEKQVKGGPLKPGDRAIMANLSEPQLKDFVKNHPASVIEYTRMNMGRMYPFGLRFDSSNADPMWAWSHGFQMAALNLQGKDRPAWLGKGFFLANGGCGYVRKPEILLPESSLDYEEILNLPPKLVLKVTVLLGTHWHTHFDYFKKPDFYVKVATHGIPADALKKKTQVALSNKEPHWEDEEFEFPIRVPDIAVLRFEVWEHDRMNPDDFVGQVCLPVHEIRSGIRVVQLRSKKGKLRSSKLLVNLKLEYLDGSQSANGAL